jgi:hypothetical protein
MIYGNSGVRLVRTISVKAQCDIAVETKTAIFVFGKSLTFDVCVYFATLATFGPMLRTISLDMVYRQKFDMGFPTAFAFAAIGRDNFALQTPVCLSYLL